MERGARNITLLTLGKIPKYVLGDGDFLQNALEHWLGNFITNNLLFLPLCTYKIYSLILKKYLPVG